jgi:RNA polymerase sigma-70 factor (ECF subfamily)
MRTLPGCAMIAAGAAGGTETRTARGPTFSMTPSEVDDAELVRRIRAGNEEAFAMLFVRHAPAVRRFLGGVVRNPAAADDALQETFARAHRKIGALREPGRPRPWLLGIARIVALDEGAAGARRTAISAVEETSDASLPLPETPEQSLLSAEAEALLADELSKLPAPRRAALLLRLDHDLDYGEIAEAMGWPLHKVKNEIHRARAGIRVRLLTYLRGRE